MSFAVSVMKFVDRMLVLGRKREAKKHPADTAKLAAIDEAIAEVRADRMAEIDEKLASARAKTDGPK
jgi:hypothetical protein